MTAPEATSIWNNTGLISFISNMNNETGYMIMLFALLAVAAIFFLMLARYSINTRLIVSSFMCTMMSFLFWYAGIVPFTWTVACFSVMAAVYLYDRWNSND
jgi:hypothetical protein